VSLENSSMSPQESRQAAFRRMFSRKALPSCTARSNHIRWHLPCGYLRHSLFHSLVLASGIEVPANAARRTYQTALAWAQGRDVNVVLLCDQCSDAGCISICHNSSIPFLRVNRATGECLHPSTGPSCSLGTALSMDCRTLTHVLHCCLHRGAVDQNSIFPNIFSRPESFRAVAGRNLPVNHATVPEALAQLISSFQPIVILHLGGTIAECAAIATLATAQSQGRSVVLCFNPPRNATEEELFRKVPCVAHAIARR